jgi:Lrp/AsnC family leucine-responsive transcriptional regulator
MIDKKERRVLAELDIDSRSSLSKMAKSCNMSQQLAGYKLKRLSSTGIVQGFYTLVDYSRFGQSCFRTYMSVGYKSTSEFRRLMTSLSENPHVTEISECGGRWDVILTILAENASRFNKILKSIIAENPALKDFGVVTNVVTHEFSRKYLNTRRASPDIILGGDREPLLVSKTDRLVLSELFMNPRKTAAQLSARLSMNPRTVSRSILRMQKSGIIKGFRPLIDASLLGRTHSRMLIKYGGIDPARERELVAYCRSHSSIVSVNKVLGAWDIEIDIEARPGESLRSCIMGIRESFDDIIKETDSMEIFRSHKKTLITRDVLGVHDLIEPFINQPNKTG